MTQDVISGFCCEVDRTHILLGCFAASSGNSLQTVWDNLLVLSSWVKKSKMAFLPDFWTLEIQEESLSSRISWPWEKGPKHWSEMSIRCYHCTLCNVPEECISLGQFYIHQNNYYCADIGFWKGCRLKSYLWHVTSCVHPEFMPLCKFLQGEQKVSVHLMITTRLSCLTTWLNVAACQPTARARGTLDSR
jgi:hypothetical protein